MKTPTKTWSFADVLILRDLRGCENMVSHAKNNCSSDLHGKCEEGKPVCRGSKVVKGELLILTGKGEGNQV